MKHIVTIVQARVGSSRFPGKILQMAAGKTMLELQLERMLRAELAGTLVVAVPEGEADDPVAEIAARMDLPVFRGHPTNLLDRHFQAARKYQPDAVVKIPSDCPLIDPAVIDRVIRSFLKDPCDYCSNLHPATYPDGNDVEIMTFDALESAWLEATKGFELEHTTPFLWERRHRFRIRNVEWESGKDFSMSHRFVLDYPEDLTFIRAVYEALYPENPFFGLEDILALLRERSELLLLNTRFHGVNWYRHHLNELKTISPGETRMEENHAPRL